MIRVHVCDEGDDMVWWNRVYLMALYDTQLIDTPGHNMW